MANPPLWGPDVREVCVPVATVWTSPGAPREIDRDAVRDQPDVVGWTAGTDAAMRKGLIGLTLTQLLMGEPVRVVEEQGGWVRAVALSQPSTKDPGGYPGWVRRAHLGTPVIRTGGTTASVVTRSTALHHEDTTVEVSFGTSLCVDTLTAETVVVLLPGGGSGTISRADVRLTHEQQAHCAQDILASARQFLCRHYLWGGTSAWGLDCSGLVHLTYRAHDVVVPRDACDQADDVEPVPLDDVEPGDLYFFARPEERAYHVGFATRRVTRGGTRWMLHAPEGGCIEDAPMAPHRIQTLVSAGRVRRP